jgi:CRISPR-associated endonuclease Cas3-HD
LAQAAAPGEPALHHVASMAGLLHDYGKNTECFQKMIREGRGRCPRSIHGAIAARQFWLPRGEHSHNWAMPVVRAIAAHHAGLLDDAELRSKTNAGLRSKARPGRQAPDSGGYAATAEKIRPIAFRDEPAIERILDASPPPSAHWSQDLLTRILLSCLVDADRLDTARRTNVQAPLHASKRLEQLLLHLNDLHAQAVARGGNKKVLDTRDQVQ